MTSRMSLLSLMTLLLLGLLASAELATAPTAFAQIETVQMGVNGMIWPIWAYGVDKALSRLDGVDKASVSLRKARADIRLEPGAPLDVAKLREAVAKAGFTPTWVKFQALGRLVEQDGQLVFKPKGSEQVIPVEDTETLAQFRAKVLGKEVAITALIPAKKDTAQIESVRVR